MMKDMEERIYDYVLWKGVATTKDIVLDLGVSAYSVMKSIGPLLDNGLLVRVDGRPIAYRVNGSRGVNERLLELERRLDGLEKLVSTISGKVG